MKKHLIYIVALVFMGVGAFNIHETSTTYAQPTETKTIQTKEISNQTQNTEFVEVTPLEIVANPSGYLNQKIKMKATFDKFSTLGLDYTPALRKAENYIGILIRRDDITDHVMPLPEMKIFLERKTAEKYIDLESGDKIEIEGKVFSTAMGDAWIDITKLTVISSKKPIKAS